MTGDLLELQKESFWRQHQDTLVKLRQELVSGRSKVKLSSAGRNVTSGIYGNAFKHPPFGKYRRTPSPYLPKMDKYHKTTNSKFELIPPVKPKLAFYKHVEDYDSWGEVSDEVTDDDDNENRLFHKKQTYHPQYKPQAYPQVLKHKLISALHKRPVTTYYPPQPNGQVKDKQKRTKRLSNSRYSKHSQQQHTKIDDHRPTRHVTSRDKQASGASSTSSIQSEGSQTDQEEEDESLKVAFMYWQQHPVFASDFTDWLIEDYLHTELCPDFLLDTFQEMQHMPYDHELYLPSLNCCQEIISDHVSETIRGFIQEAIIEVSNSKGLVLQWNPTEEFLTSLIDNVIITDTRDIVRNAVVELAEEYLESQYNTDIIHMLVDECVLDLAPQLLEETLFDIVAEEFLNSEVIGPEITEESAKIAFDTVQYLDTKVMKSQMEDVKQMAEIKLTDVILMELILCVMSQPGHLETEEEQFMRHLDGIVWNESITQMISVNRERERTLYSKPLHKLHEKLVSDVGLDACLQLLTWSLDEDMADVDEFEKSNRNQCNYFI